MISVAATDHYLCGGRYLGRLAGRRKLERNRRRVLLVRDAECRVDWRMDLVNCLIKSVVFAIMVTWIALFNGYDAIPTFR